jgi:hypothetical protein
VPCELRYGDCHCFGKTTYRHRVADSVNEARSRADAAREDFRRPVPPGSDTVGACPVAGDPGHGQGPWVACRPAPCGEEAQP